MVKRTGNARRGPSHVALKLRVWLRPLVAHGAMMVSCARNFPRGSAQLFEWASLEAHLCSS